jgi:CubicO group peptidase (beta-lactamase class C family)
MRDMHGIRTFTARTALDMNLLSPVLLGVLLAALAPGASGVQAAAAVTRQAETPSPEARVDALFAPWNKPGVPGAVIEVIRDSKVVLRKAYGMADIERGVPMTPGAILNTGSVTKQFTAFAIHLLEQEGKLALGADVRTYLPELADFGATITLRHLLQHTSGLRDPTNLMALQGWRVDDIATTDDILAIITRQRTLNFSPGNEYLYSNGGYDLLAQVVRRVSGKPLPVFVHERIFTPLGMKHSSFREHYASLVPGRALSYQAAPGGYRNATENRSNAGPAGLLSTVDDLALWQRNFEDAKLGGKELIARMHETTPLNDGKPNNYASGLFIESYRGRRLVEHSGSIAGYRSVLARYPDQGLSVILLANGSDISTVALGRKVADIYLGDTALAPVTQVSAAIPAGATPAARAEMTVDPIRFDALAGYYALSPTDGIHVTRSEGTLMGRLSGQHPFRMYPSSERDYFLKVADARISFDPLGPDGVVSRLVLHQDGRQTPGTRETIPLPPRPADYTGEFYSDELHLLYTVTLENGGLQLTYPRGTMPLDYAGEGKFMTYAPVSEVRYQCTPEGGCTGFTVTNTRVRNLQFTRVAIVGPGARPTKATGVFLAPAATTQARTSDAAQPDA